MHTTRFWRAWCQIPPTHRRFSKEIRKTFYMYPAVLTSEHVQILDGNMKGTNNRAIQLQTELFVRNP